MTSKFYNSSGQLFTKLLNNDVKQVLYRCFIEDLAPGDVLFCSGEAFMTNNNNVWVMLGSSLQLVPNATDGADANDRVNLTPSNCSNIGPGSTQHHFTVPKSAVYIATKAMPSAYVLFCVVSAADGLSPSTNLVSGTTSGSDEGYLNVVKMRGV